MQLTFISVRSTGGCPVFLNISHIVSITPAVDDHPEDGSLIELTGPEWKQVRDDYRDLTQRLGALFTEAYEQERQK